MGRRRVRRLQGGLRRGNVADREATWNTVRELYDWWKKRKNDNEHDDYDEDSAMLHKLIDVRGCLWT